MKRADKGEENKKKNLKSGEKELDKGKTLKSAERKKRKKRERI